jgi:tetratricopeptide (TPR) repeat protein
VSIYRTFGPKEPPVGLICHLGIIAMAEGDYARAKGRLEEGLRLATRLSDPRGRYDALHLLGELEQHLGDPARATELLTQSMELARRAGDRPRENFILGALADVALTDHDLDRATGLYREGLRYWRGVEDWRGAAYAVAGLAAVAAIHGDVEKAGRLWGGLGGLEHALGWHIADFEITRYEQLVADNSDTGSIRFTAAAERGRRMNIGEVVEYALGDSVA